MNDIIAVSTITISEELEAAIQQAFINISQTTEGLDVMRVYAHMGYVIVNKEDYETTKFIQEILGN